MRTSEVTDRHTKEINILHVLVEYLFKTEFELKESILNESNIYQVSNRDAR